jgi:nitroreductase
VESESAIKKLDEAHPCRYGAPTSLIVCADNRESFTTDEIHKSGEIDACIVATHMMLEATNLDVDNIWTWAWGNTKLVQEFAMPEGVEPICVLPLGYRSEEDHGSHNHGVRKDVAELVEYI